MTQDEVQQHILDAFDLSDLPEELKEAFLIQFGELVYKNVMMRAAELLGEDDIEEFDALIADSTEPQAIFQFLEKKLPNFEDIISEEVVRLKQESDILTEAVLAEETA